MERCPECGGMLEPKNYEIENYEELVKIGSDLALYNLFYDLVVREEKRLQKQDVAEDYRLCKALASCYELQDYLASRITLLEAEEK